MRTKTMAVAKVLKAEGRGTWIFNDRMVDGRRSLKVWGWSLADYEQAKTMLEDWGCQVELVQALRYINRIGQKRMVTRLHVQE